MKSLVSALALAGALMSFQGHAAPAFSLEGGYTGDLSIKLQNWESFTMGLLPGSQNFGIVRITTVEDIAGNATLWASGDAGAELTGVFRGITVVSSDATGNVQSTGGVLDLYINPEGSFAAAGGAAQGHGGYCAVDFSCYDGITNVATGELFLSLAFASGIDANPLITVDGDFDGGTFPGTGDAAGYLNVTGGAYADNFDTNTIVTVGGDIRDMFFQNRFRVNGAVGAAVGDWQLISDDPVIANFIPEPGSLALVGLALLGFAGLRRKFAA